MLQITSFTDDGLFGLICQQCQAKTRNEYLGAHQFRTFCPSCRTSRVLTFDYLCWSGLPLQASTEVTSELTNVAPTTPEVYQEPCAKKSTRPIVTLKTEAVDEECHHGRVVDYVLANDGTRTGQLYCLECGQLLLDWEPVVA